MSCMRFVAATTTTPWPNELNCKSISVIRRLQGQTLEGRGGKQKAGWSVQSKENSESMLVPSP